MSKQDKDTMAPDMRELLDRASSPEPAPAEVRDRLWSRLEESAGASALSGEGERSGDRGDRGDSGMSGSEGGLLSSLVTGATPWWTGLGFVVGAAVGVGGYALVDSPREQQVVEQQVEAPEPPVEEVERPPDEKAERPPVEKAERPPDEKGKVEKTERSPVETAEPEDARAPVENPVEKRSTEPATRPVSTLAEERLLLTRAQSALARQRPEAALEALLEHRDRFGDGALAEERGALVVQTLLQAGRAQEARRRAAAFVEKHPNSIFLELVTPALGPTQ